MKQSVVLVSGGTYIASCRECGNRVKVYVLDLPDELEVGQCRSCVVEAYEDGRSDGLNE